MLVCVGTFVCTEARDQCQGSSLIVLHLIYWGRVSHVNPEFTDSISLASRLALGIPYLHIPALGPPEAIMSAWNLCRCWLRIWNSVFMSPRQALCPMSISLAPFFLFALDSFLLHLSFHFISFHWLYGFTHTRPLKILYFIKLFFSSLLTCQYTSLNILFLAVTFKFMKDIHN